MKRRPRKIITRIIVFLLLGAIVNVAVAWGSAACFSAVACDSAHLARMNSDYRGIVVAMESRHEDSDEIPIPRLAGRSLFRDILKCERFHRGERGIIFTTHTHSCGFPERALQGTRIESRDFGNIAPYEGRLVSLVPSITVEFANAIGLNQNVGFCQGRDRFVLESTQKILPTSAIWPGFAINTMFYAGVLWMVFAFPFMVRRRRRIKRGLCPACAYPVGQSPVCTECGKAVRLHIHNAPGSSNHINADCGDH